jgi:hypothetical protein
LAGISQRYIKKEYTTGICAEFFSRKISSSASWIFLVEGRILPISAEAKATKVNPVMVAEMLELNLRRGCNFDILVSKTDLRVKGNAIAFSSFHA